MRGEERIGYDGSVSDQIRSDQIVTGEEAYPFSVVHGVCSGGCVSVSAAISIVLMGGEGEGTIRGVGGE
jgi:hypothetical protein